MLGSEGILGVITEAWMRLQERPRFRSKATMHFGDFDAAVRAVRALSQSGLHPANCRLLDVAEAMVNQVAVGVNVVVLGFESGHHPVRAALDVAIQVCREEGGSCADGPHHTDDGGRVRREGGGGRWRDAFLRAPYLHSALCQMGVVVDTFETACTWDRFDALHADVTASVERAMTELCGGGLVTCRFTHVYPDGPAPYYTFLAPGRSGPDVAGQLAQWAGIKEAASEALMRHGATITHHHAVGRVHRPWYDRQRPEPFARALGAAKAALDPAGILNPGVLIDPVG
jgi:alkyldihydroxyacetonephosphate synthase